MIVGKWLSRNVFAGTRTGLRFLIARREGQRMREPQPGSSSSSGAPGVGKLDVLELTGRLVLADGALTAQVAYGVEDGRCRTIVFSSLFVIYVGGQVAANAFHAVVHLIPPSPPYFVWL